MEKFRTEIIPDPLPLRIGYSDNILLLGSCFTEHIGLRMSRLKFQVEQNPFGIVYNPASVAIGLDRLIKSEPYRLDDLFFYDDLWHSYDHHSRFSDPDPESCLSRINYEIERASVFLRKVNYLILTFGSARAYRLVDSGKVVTNCHKVEASAFVQELLRIGDVVHAFQRIIGDLMRINTDLQVILTISPVRYWKDGPQGNQVSKSTLVLTCSELSEKFENVHYFPAYEIFMDDLRDYRFYGSDLIHPGDSGIEYVWSRFVQTCIAPSAAPIMKEVEQVIRSFEHRPTGFKTPSYRNFLKKNIETIKKLQVRFPFMDFQNELGHFNNELASFDS